jgi:hypothetical protein
VLDVLIGCKIARLHAYRTKDYAAGDILHPSVAAISIQDKKEIVHPSSKSTSLQADREDGNPEGGVSVA